MLILKKIKIKNYQILIFLLLSILLLTWPYLSPTRSLHPHDFNTSNYELKPLITKLSDKNLEENYKIVMSPDLILEKKYFNFHEIKKWHLENNLEKQKKLFAKHPEVYPRKIHLNMSVNGKNLEECSIAAWLDTYKSDVISCERIRKKGFASFSFPELKFIPFGIHDAKIKLIHKDSKSDLSLSFNHLEDPQNIKWLHIFTREDMSSIKSLYYFSLKKPFLFLIYLISILCIFYLLSSSNISFFKKIIVIFICQLIAISIITTPISGHDETHHFDNFFASLRQKISEKNSKKNPSFEKLNSLGKDYMINEHFFRLHGVIAKPGNPCLHYHALNGCNFGSILINYYNLYVSFLPQGLLEEMTPKILTLVSRTVNFFLLLVALFLIFFLIPKEKFLAMISCLLFFGGYFSQHASLTNDIAMFLLGIFILSFFLQSFSYVPIWKRLSLFLISCLYLLLSSRFDVSYISAILPLIFAAILSLSKVILDKLKKERPFKTIKFTHFALISITLLILQIPFTYYTFTHIDILSSYILDPIAPQIKGLLPGINYKAVEIKNIIFYTHTTYEIYFWHLCLGAQLLCK